MRKYRNRRSRRHNNGRKFVLMASIALPIATVVGGGMAMNSYMAIEQADEHFCYARDDQRKSAVYVDSSIRSSDLTEPQFRDYSRAFEQVFDDAPANTLISLFTSAKGVSSTLVKPVFTICKPAGTPAEQEALGAPSKPAPYLIRQLADVRAAYMTAVAGILADVKDPSKAAGDSPILEQIQSLSRHKAFQGASRSLTVITDGIQNSEIARFCHVAGDMPVYELFKERPAYDYIRPMPFYGTDVSVMLIEYGTLPSFNLAHCTNDEMRAWWPDYFRGNGAKSVVLTRLRRWAGS